MSRSKPRIIPEHARGSVNPTWLIIIIAVLGAIGGLLVGLHGQPDRIDIESLTRYPEPRKLKALSLDSADGPVTEDAFRDQWDLLFFGFTHCPDVCPNTMALLRQTVHQFESNPPRVWLISVDPERDTPEILQSYVEYFHPEFRSATGSPDAIADLASQLNVAYFIEPHEDGDTSYTVDHSSAVLVVSPDAELFALASAPLDPLVLAADLRQLRDSF